MANTITADDIREHFSQAMSAMYQQEVPQYGTLLELVADVNPAVLENNPLLHEQLANADELARLNVERHGAIRVGTAKSFLPCVVCLPSWACTRSATMIFRRRAFRFTRRHFARWMMRRCAATRFVSLPHCCVLS